MNERGAPGAARSDIVIFRPGALGDTILTGDALVAIRSRWPDHRLELIGNAQAGALLAAAGLVDRVTSFDSTDVTELYSAGGDVPTRWRSADLAVLWLPTPDPVQSALRAAGARHVIWGHPFPPAGVHAADHLLATLGPIGIGPDRLRWFIPGRTPGPRLMASVGQRIALVHPGSGAPGKNWPPERFAALIHRLRSAEFTVRVLRGPADHEAVRRLERILKTRMPPIVEPAKTDELIANLAAAAVFVGNDSGVSHLSARLEVPTVAVFGTTDPRQWAPRGPCAVAIAGSPWPTEVAVYEAVVRILQSDSITPPD